MPRELGLIGATAIAVRAVLDPARRREDVRVRAIAASTPERAEAFRAEHGLPVAHADYRSLVRDEGIDTVYVSLHNSAHARWAAEAARAGKHVVVEKPLCLGRREAHALRRAAGDAGVHVVEAVITTGHPWQAAVRELVASRELGELTGISSHIAFDLPPGAGYRFRPELGGGAFHDTASYWLDAVQAVVGLGGATASGHSEFSGPNGVDLEFDAALRLPSGVRAELRASLVGPYRADHEFRFTGGKARLRNFLRPAAGPFPVNLVLQRDGGAREVRSFPAVSYHDAQFDRIMALLARPARPDDAVVERIAVLESAYLNALERCARTGRAEA
ncbi:Gfo/Idh/MocA family protein [Actinosynnema sp.]|uniref:Gfo/Idh/MocA family protein n=1 Tax=Actinosynnema sp. TaxID=1872144 RepID=UPI003F87A933